MKTNYKNLYFYILLAELTLTASSFPWEYSVNNNKGVYAYENKNYKVSEENFEKALIDEPTNLTLKYNLAGSFYQQKRYAEAQSNYLEILKNNDTESELKEKTYYNLANTLYRMGEESKHEKLWSESLKYYEKTIDINPQNTNAKENYEFVKKQLEMLRKNETNKNQENKTQNNPNNKSNNDPNSNKLNSPSTENNFFDKLEDNYNVTNSEIENTIKDQKKDESFMQNYINRHSLDSKNKVFQYMKKDW